MRLVSSSVAALDARETTLSLDGSSYLQCFILYTHPSSNRGRWWSNHAMVSWLWKDSCHTARQRLPWWEFTEKLSILLEEWYFFVSIISLIGSICNR